MTVVTSRHAAEAEVDEHRPHGGVFAHSAADAGAGGDGGVTSEQDGGGPVLDHARVSLIYWGSAWGTANPSTSQFTTAINDLIGGPWGTQLNQYHSIGPSSLDQIVSYGLSDPPAAFVESDIKTFVDDRINDGTVFATSSSVQRIYAVLLPTGHSSSDTTFVGRHQNYARSNGDQVYYAWVTNDGTLTGGNSIPKVFSHELAESVSDPKVTTGPTAITLNGDGDEIGDVCNNTWATVNGHAEEAYWSEADNRCVIPQFQALPAATADPVLIQSRFGRQGNFEAVVAQSGGGMFHTWRNNDNAYMPWGAATSFAPGLEVNGVAMMQSNFGDPGNLEVVANANGQLYALWRDSGPAFAWSAAVEIEAGFAVDGDPALIQSRFGAQGNFELVVAALGGGLAHFWRNDDDAALPWSAATLFGEGLGYVTGVSLIESNYGNPGNLEVVVNADGRLYHFWRDSGPEFQWSGPTAFAPDFEAAGDPVLIQSRFGTQGNFELVVAAAAGGLAHFWRNNDDAALLWNGPTAFGQSLGPVTGVGMIQSNYGNPGNLEVLANANGQLYHLWRDSGPAFAWSHPYNVNATVW